MQSLPPLHRLLVLAVVWLLLGCAAHRVVSVGRFPTIDPPLKTIALAPSGGIFADVIGIELSARGYTIADTGTTLALLVMMHKTPDDLFMPEVMAKLKDRGIDAILTVQKTDGEDGLPQTVQIRLYGTEPVADLGGVAWRNGWIRRGVLESAQEIARAMHQEAPAVEAPADQRQY
jgi:hypothetical protein